ncbi:CheR family methyltransferase [Sphingomicrobium lutaoense]|uniref:Chemotaxis protein methyltransferase CheR n=1 Tax=Sphingomicrobium lutaoense TaxID=515949 RepID=A0A839YZ96_9SPHN|nr:protein-glutamate O-methyltransferase CheR [Sphingomicrobium lutaoense]MBB3763648.1 chemotaxis protein methyltransferase CheR [Sphingomicrobium lutaoense]
MSRRWRIETALSSVLRERNIPTLDRLISMLIAKEDPFLADEVVEALLNNETYFFRDRTPFDVLARDVLPQLAHARRDQRRLRIWSAGCSTGQEAYSLAMLFDEDRERWKDWKIEILGSDVSQKVIDKARAGRYTQFEVQRGLAIRQTIRWFEEEEDGWTVAPHLKSMVRFETRNLLDPQGARQFDLVLCRNVLLYLCKDKRRQAFDRLASVIASDGALLLGAGETVIGQTEAFAADRDIRGIYRPAALQAPARRATGT